MSSNEVIHEQIAKYLSGEASPEEAMQVEAWGNQSKEVVTFGYVHLSSSYPA